MAQQREATTDRLVGIIANIKMERKSGQLWVRRGKGLTSEEGILTFIQGQITRASVGRRSGADALNWLSTWGQAHYIFTAPGSQEALPMSLAALPSSASDSGLAHPAPRGRSVNTDRLEAEPLEPTQQEIPRICVAFSEAIARMERSGLPRAHRRLYLLIDGHRSISELEPLIGRKGDEIRSMLHDLEWLGIVQMNHAPS